MPIISGGKKIDLRPNLTARRPLNTLRSRTFQLKTSKKLDLRAYGMGIAKVEDDLAVVREHYGLNISDSLAVALHLAAKAIRNNKALPEI